MDSPHVYETSAEGPLRQGEIVANIHQLVTTLTDENGQQVTRPGQLVHPYAVVLSQDCDLDWDFKNRQSGGPEANPKNLPNILFCELHEAATLKTQSDLKSDQWKRVRQNKDERYQFLESCPKELDCESVGLPDLAIDFKRFFTVPTRDVYAQMKSMAKRRTCLKHP